jgi:Protein of unknown function (DUF3892)
MRYEVSCITKRGNHLDPHERIERIGFQGIWYIEESRAIRRIETGMDSFYTMVDGREADIIVATHNGRKYLKTIADGYSPNNLLSLPECVNCKTLA